MIKLPRLYINGEFRKLINPISVSITENLTPLSTATITLPRDDMLPARSWVELFTPYGSAGMFRVRSPRDAYGQETATAELEHMISEVGDWLVKEEISEMTPADAAMKKVFSHYKGGKWKLGSVSALGTGKIALEVKYDRVLDAMLAILEQRKNCMMAFDFTTSPWTVSIVKKGTSVTAEGRLSRNVRSATISYDDTELVTRVWYQTYTKDKKGNQTAKWVSKTDEDAKKKYGVVEGTVRTDANMTDEEVAATVNAFLSDHCAPRVSVSIQAGELAQITGESMDKFLIGRMMRLALPDYGVTVEEVITSVVWQDVYNAPMSVTVNMGAEEDTVVTFLHNLDSKGSGGGGGGKKKKEEEEAWSAYKVEWEKLDNSVVGMVALQDRQGKILQQAGMTLNEKGVLIYEKNIQTGLYNNFVLGETFESEINDPKNGLRSKINQTQNTMEFLVEGTGNNAHIKPASIQSAIDAASGQSKITLSADHIILDGNVVANAIRTSEITVSSLEVTNGLDCNDIECSTVDCTAVVVNSGDVNAPDGYGVFGGLKVYDSGDVLRTATWKTATLPVLTYSQQRNWVYKQNGTEYTFLGYAIGTKSTETIHYLGY